MNTKAKKWRFTSIIMSIIMIFSLFSDVTFSPIMAHAENDYTVLTDRMVILSGETVCFEENTHVGNATFTADTTYTLTQIKYDSTQNIYVEVDEYVENAFYVFSYLDAQNSKKFLLIYDGDSAFVQMTEKSDGIEYKSGDDGFIVHEDLVGTIVLDGDTINIAGKYYEEEPDHIVQASREFTLAEVDYDEYNNVWIFKSTESEEDSSRMSIFIPDTEGKDAIGFKVAGGDGSENNPYTFEVEYEVIDYYIIKSEMTNGTVTAKVNNVETSTIHENDEVTLEVNPDAGYNLDYILASETYFNEPTTTITEINQIISMIGDSVYYKNGVSDTTSSFIKKGHDDSSEDDNFTLFGNSQSEGDYEWVQDVNNFELNTSNASNGVYDVVCTSEEDRTLRFTIYDNSITSIIVNNCGSYNGVYLIPDEKVELTETQSGTYTFTQADKNVIIYAYFIECGYILDASGGIINLGTDGIYSKKKFALAELKSMWQKVANNTLREGYEFLGWYDNNNEEFTSESLSNVESLSGMIILHAEWKLKEYSIIIPECENGTITAVEGVTIADDGKIKAKYGDSVTITATGNDGYSFDESFLKVVKGESEPQNGDMTFDIIKDYIEIECKNSNLDKANVIFVDSDAILSGFMPKKAAGYVCSVEGNNVSWTFDGTNMDAIKAYYNVGTAEYEEEDIEDGNWIYSYKTGADYYFIDLQSFYPELTKLSEDSPTYTFKMPSKNVSINGAFEAKEYTINYLTSAGQLDPTNITTTYKINSNSFDIPMPTYTGTTYAFNGWNIYNYGDEVPNTVLLDEEKRIATRIMDYTVKKGTMGNLVFEELSNDVSTIDETQVRTNLNSELDNVITSFFYTVAAAEVGETEAPVFIREELKIKKADENNANEVSSGIKSAAGSLFNGVSSSDIEVKYINMDITKYQTKSDGTKLPNESVTDIGGVFEIAIPFESLGFMTEKSNFGVIREHGTGANKKIDVFTKLNARVVTQDDMKDATFFIDTDTNTLCIYTRFFSTYAFVGTSETICQVLLDVNGGNELSKTIYNVVSGGKLNLPTPTRSSYTFDGWYTLATGGSKVTSSTSITADMTLYAHWSSNSGGGGDPTPTYYTVTFNSNGGSLVSSQSVISGGKATKPTDPTKEGFTFDGWYSDANLTIAYDFNSAVYSSKTLHAKWKENTITPVVEVTYTVTFETNGGSSVSSQTVISGNKVSKPENPIKEGYTFDGWYSDVDLTTEFNFDTAITKNTTLYAKWNKNSSISENSTYTVTFDSNGGTSVSSQDVISGNKATKPDDPTNGNLVFIGWFLDPTLDNIINEETLEYNTFDFDTPIKEDITLKALWLARLNVNVSGEGQIAIAEAGKEIEFSDDFPAQSVYQTAIIGLYDKFTIGTKAKAGNKFVKWQKKIDEDVYEDYSLDAQITVTITDHLDLVAVFETSTEIRVYDEHPTLYLKANVTDNAKKQTSVAKLTWKSVKEANTYEVYGATADQTNSLIKVATLKKNKKSYTVNDLEWGKEYVYLVKAVKADGTVLMESLDVYFVTGLTSESNAKSISAKSIKVRMGESAQLQPSIKTKEKDKNVFGEKYTSLYRYFSSNPAIAEVDENGVVTAKAVGKVTIFVYAPNGVIKKVTVNCENPLLFLKASVKENTKNKTSKVVLNWTTAKGATEYNIYGAEYGIALEKIATVKKNQKSYTISDLEWGKEYGFVVQAVNAEGTEFWESTFIHFVAGSDTQTNAKNVKASNMTLTVGSKNTINTTLVGKDSSKTAITGFTYFSLQPNVATVDEDGTVNAIAKGKATVYIFAPNGVKKSIKVTVK